MVLNNKLNFILSLSILIASLSLFLVFFLASSGYINTASEPDITAETNTTGVPEVDASNNSAIDGVKLEKEIFNKVNEIRGDHGIDPFIHSERVRLISRLHSADMGKRGYFNHSDPEGKNPRDRHKIYKGCENPNENIAKIQYSTIKNPSQIASRIVSLWRDSPGHNKSMMTSFDNVAGVGVYVTQNRTVYVTMNFCREHPNA